MANTAVVYERDYAGKTLNFEPSGGLTNASLVMQDKETDTYWSLMKGAALEGELKGQQLKEMPIGEKTTWKQWKSRHPKTKVLSINNSQDGSNPYVDYFAGDQGFRGVKAKDDRLATMTPVFAFRIDDTPFAIEYLSIESGWTTQIGETHLFFYRDQEDELFRSTSTFVSETEFEKSDGKWKVKGSEAIFDPASRSFGKTKRFKGFDTFWYNWSLNNPSTKLLGKEVQTATSEN